jgi:hypothetical protein
MLIIISSMEIEAAKAAPHRAVRRTGQTERLLGKPDFSHLQNITAIGKKSSFFWGGVAIGGKLVKIGASKAPIWVENF